MLAITKNTTLRPQSHSRTDCYQHLIYSTGFRNVAGPYSPRRRSDADNQQISLPASPPAGLAMSAMSKTVTCRNVVVGTPHTSEVCPEPEGAVGLRPTYPRLLSELPTHLSTELFACAELVRLSAGRVLFRAGILATAAIALRTDSSMLRWFRAPAPSAFLRSSAKAPSSVSFLLGGFEHRCHSTH